MREQKGTVLFCIFLTLSTILKKYQKYKTKPSPFVARQDGILSAYQKPVSGKRRCDDF